MGKKVEKIIINEDYVYPRVSKTSIPKDKLYVEKSNVLKREIVLNKNLSFDAQKEELVKFVNNLYKKINKIEIDYAFLKLFKYIVKSDIDTQTSFLKDNESFNKFLKTFKLEVEKMNAKLKMESGIVSTKEYNDKIDSEYEEILSLYNYASGLHEDLEDMKKKYYHEFKVSSYSIIHNKNLEEINDLISRVEEEMAKYRSVSNANDYLVYNSGLDIQGAVDEFCKLGKKYPYITYHYFLNQDAIIVFKFQEWMELFIKFNNVLNKVNKKDITVNMMNKYRIIETKYTILLINGEM